MSEPVMRVSVYDCGNSPEAKPEPQAQPSQDGANSRQIGGTHYKQFTYETWDVITDWGLGYLDGNAVKYLSRWRYKNGLEDLKKARHYIDKLIEVEQNKT